MITLSAPIVTSSPIATPSWTRTCARMSQERPTIAPSTTRRAADLRRRVDDRPVVRAPSRSVTLVAEHGVRADGRVGRDRGVVAEERRALDRVEIVHVDALPHPDVAAQADPGHVEPHALVERVEVRLPVLVEVPDVLPVAVDDVAVHRPAHLEQQREELLREVVRAVRRDVPQHLRLEHVDAGVDRVGEDLAPRRLLEEALDAAVLVGDDDPELERVLDRLEADRDRAPFSRWNSTSFVRSTSQSASPEMTRNVSSSRPAASRTEPAVPSGDSSTEYAMSMPSASPSPKYERIACGRNATVTITSSKPWSLQQLDDVLHARLADDRHHRLRLVRGQRTKARALAARHDDGLHARTAFQASRT